MEKVKMNYKRIVSCIMVVLFLGLQIPSMVFAAETTSVNNEGITSGKHYKITSKQSKKVIDVSNAGKNNGELIQQWEDKGVANQQWIIEEVQNGYFKITSCDSKKVIDIKDASSNNGATIHQWDFVNADNQLWYFEKTDDGYYQIKSKKNNKCLDIKGISPLNGAKLQLWDDVNSDNQKWNIEEIVKKEANIVSGASYKIVNKNSSKSIEIAGGVTNNGGQAQQWDYLSKNSQEWTFNKVDDTYFKIISNNSGKVLDVKDASKNNGAYIHQWDYVGADNQLWYIEVCNDGFYQIKSKQSNKCLDIYGISKNNGARLQLWDDVDSDNQKWSLEIVSSEEDNDNDGLTNIFEWNNGLDANKADSDGDGLNDYDELYITKTNPLKVDSDGNGILDGEEDFDHDGLTNKQEISVNGNPFNADTDSDGINDLDEVKLGTAVDKADTDVDGLKDSEEINITKTNPLKADSDGNGILDGEEDFDHDGLTNKQEISVNGNLFNADTDSDGINDSDEVKFGTAVDKADTDADGLKDSEEINITKTNPLKADSDGNGILDGEEDFDHDGLTNKQEISVNGNPFNKDTDSDGLNDKEEVSVGTAVDKADTDLDGLRDSLEIILGINPLNADTNGNGIIDGQETVYVTTTENANVKIYRNGDKVLVLLKGLTSEDDEMIDNVLKFGFGYESSEVTQVKNLVLTLAPRYLNYNIYIAGGTVGGYLDQYFALINNADTDGDGLKYSDEINITKTNPLKADSDGNGILDGEEDFDHDGLTNKEELNVNGNPFKNDTDSDGINDFEEVKLGTAVDKADTNGNGILDGQETVFVKTIKNATVKIYKNGDNILVSVRGLTSQDYLMIDNLLKVGLSYESPEVTELKKLIISLAPMYANYKVYISAGTFGGYLDQYLALIK